MENSLENLTLNQEIPLTEAKIQIGEQLGLDDTGVDRLFLQLQKLDEKGTVIFQENTMSQGSFRLTGKDRFGSIACKLAIFQSDIPGEDPQVRNLNNIDLDDMSPMLRKGVRSGENLDHDEV